MCNLVSLFPSLVMASMIFIFQVKNHSSVNSVSAASLTAVTGRSTHKSTQPPNLMTARPWAAPSPTPIPAHCANTWRSTSSPRLPLSLRTCTPSSLISSLTQISSNPWTLKWTTFLNHSPTKMLTFLFCPVMNMTSAQIAKQTTRCYCGAHLRQQCLWICLCQAWRVS